MSQVEERFVHLFYDSFLLLLVCLFFWVMMLIVSWQHLMVLVQMKPDKLQQKKDKQTIKNRTINNKYYFLTPPSVCYIFLSALYVMDTRAIEMV